MDAKRNPIPQAEVDALIVEDRELRWSASDRVELADPKTREVISPRRSYPAIEWGPHSRFWYDGAEITCKNPTLLEQNKLIEMADRLEAMVVGDEDELYRIKKTWLGKKQIVSEPWSGD